MALLRTVFVLTGEPTEPEWIRVGTEMMVRKMSCPLCSRAVGKIIVRVGHVRTTFDDCKQETF